MTIIFSISDYKLMAKSLISDLYEKGEYSVSLGETVVEEFPDGEIGTNIVTYLEEQDVVLIGSTYSDSATLRIYDLACGIVNRGARSLTLIIPYFGCSTMEREVKTGDIVTAKNRARLLSSIPKAYKNNRILLLDLHADGIVHYFENDVIVKHIYAKPIISEAIKWIESYRPREEHILASTDMGRAKWVESLGNDLKIPTAFIEKERTSGSTVKVHRVVGDVRGKQVILYDDMIRTGGSLIGAARAYKEAGAIEVSVVATHGVFAGDSLEKLYGGDFVTRIAVTDSHPNSILAPQNLPRLKVFKTSSLFCKHLSIT